MAQKTIFELNELVTPLEGTEVIPIDTGLETFKLTTDQLATYLLTLMGSSAGGGGGGGATWNQPEDGSAAESATENGEKVYLFPDEVDATLCMFFKVPSGYVAGDQISLKLGCYAASTSDDFLLTTTTYLVQAATPTAVDDATNSHASTNTAVTLDSPANSFHEITVDLTDENGEINSVAVAPGDLLRIVLTRDYANDATTETVKFIPSTTEVAFG